MAENNKKCDCGWHEGHVIFRIVLAILILLIVFWVGVEMGEMRAAISYGWGGYNNGGYHRVMMYGEGGYGGVSTVSPAHPITPENPGGPMIPATTSVTQ